jgi:hypothetical protein
MANRVGLPLTRALAAVLAGAWSTAGNLLRRQLDVVPAADAMGCSKCCRGNGVENQLKLRKRHVERSCKVWGNEIQDHLWLLAVSTLNGISAAPMKAEDKLSSVKYPVACFWCTFLCTFIFFTYISS